MLSEEDIAVPVGTTLDRFIMRKQEAFPYATGELSQLIRDIALASKIINREINRAGLINIAGMYGTQNIQGEEQQKLDVIADVRFIRALKNGGEVCAIISEEQDKIIDTGNRHGKYVVALDPLDGSSNIDVNVSIGSIFSVYRRVTPVGTVPNETDVLQSGRKQVAAGYVLYGSSTMLVYTTGHGVHGFTYDASLGEFFLSHTEIKIPEKGKIFSYNEGNYDDFSPAIQSYITDCKTRRYSGRYIGSLVADFHRNMLKGGIYLYPPTQKAPNGKLRLLYECYPLAMLIEQAGGMATDGKQPILDIVPTDLHQRTPLYIGSADMVRTVTQGLETEYAAQ
ncbi:fructose-1,6-bisphosphatase I [Flexibacter flexilis DSM 6793]|uniref:Fructose-1,6-bisphosphatase class 1 n=1 Tax=Flexibacter flexilis DSM 6793 TaxID=927664 RepID=A0A1I1G8N8_9BACT|nr:class 1 fructose-bisphosphatase [Flexibacter flexilis]SFC07756.1 fructose-1,6-bisphosphatase I [Flexibacter flexilis DSM 6793]